MLPVRLLTVLLFVSRVVTAGEPPAELEAAERALARGNTADAARNAEAGLRRSRLDRSTYLRLLELQGISLAETAAPRALKSFQMLLSLDPGRALYGDDVKRAGQTFRKAQQQMGAKGAFLATPASPTVSNGRIFQVAVEVSNDPMKLARKVRFHLRVERQGWTEQEAPLYGRAAAAGTEATSVKWWAEVLGEREVVLSTIASADSPRVESADAEATATEPSASAATTDEPRVPASLDPAPGEGPTAAVATQPEVRSRPGLRAVGYVLLASAVGAGGAGGLFGYQSAQARRKLESAEVDEQGRVVGLTQAEAYALNDRSRSQARLANTLFIAAGGLAVVGGVFVFLGREVVVAPARPGVAVAGTF